MVDDRQRAVILTHPSFQGGVEAIEETKRFVKLLMTVIQGEGMYDGVPPSQREILKDHLSKYKVLIRKLPKDLF